MSTATLHIEKTQATGERSKAKKTLVPQLRFQEFEGEWELKKLKDLTNLITKGTTPSSFSKEGVNFIKIEGLNGILINKERCAFIDESIHNKELKRSILRENDLLFAIAGATIGKTAIVTKEILPANTNQALAIIRLKDFKCLRYISQILQSEVMKKYISQSISVGAQPNLNLEQMGDFRFNIPTLPEQQKIASFLSVVDEKIQQLSRKKELLEQYKKGLMQQLFSGKLRFKDENGNDYADWEEKRISDYFQIKAGGDVNLENSSKIKTEKFKYPIYANSEKAKGLYGYSDLYKIDYNCITVSGRGALGIANARFEKFYPIVRLLILKPKKNIDVLFSQYALNLINIYPESTGVPQLTAPQYSSYLILFPCLEEQQKIANFLSSIDAKIEITNQQINQTQSFKKGLLQQLFV
ncbi:restriction endonuclease subunit S [Flavobacterium sp. Arc2]|uniref:restriction endonuclease subunit S n=1 Tax=Flavobacterium sp. Arc2 TaxID=3046685 RepID=UPI00352F0473